MTINLAKSELCHASLTFLGYIVGYGHVKPMDAKVELYQIFPYLHAKENLVCLVITGSTVIISLSLLIYSAKEQSFIGIKPAKRPLITSNL